ncbi:polysaccharide biosynthesis protein [Lysobacter ruishenii]|uniref:Polysaccharide biosynthesis protein n=2 Tax=Aerolutibacter ruishenii TaxID=686800 RepID=A0A562LI47_9GAMM|nr:polysaccharide biosynthesis protein [Lysobacter ruishenii]
MGAALVGNLAKVVRSMIGLRPARADVVDRLGNRRVATGRTGVAKHYFRYSLANALVVMAGLVSFPVLTRFLDNAQYGILGYYDTLVLVAVAVIKLGSQHAMLRFYPANGGGAVPTCQHATQQLPSFFIYNKWAPLLEYTDVP